MEYPWSIWDNLFIAILVAALLIVIICGIIDLSTAEVKTIKRDCYDKYGSRIIDLTCEQNISCGAITDIIDSRCKQ